MMADDVFRHLAPHRQAYTLSMRRPQVQRRVVPFATLPSAVLALAAAPRCSAGAAVAAVAAARADGLVSVLSTDGALLAELKVSELDSWHVGQPFGLSESDWDSET